MTSALDDGRPIRTTYHEVRVAEEAARGSTESSEAHSAGGRIASDVGGNSRIDPLVAELHTEAPGNDDEDFARLEEQADACLAGLSSELEGELGIAHSEAWRQVRAGTGRLVREQMDSLNKFDRRVRRRQLRDIQQLLEAITLEMQIRAYGRYLIKKRRSRLTKLQIEEYVDEMSFAELLAEMGHRAPAIQRYQQSRRLKRERSARDRLMQIGLSAAAAGRFLRREHAKPFDDQIRLFDEITDVANNPAQFPLHPRAGGAADQRDKRIITELDQLLKLRHTARTRRLAEGWSAKDISNWLSHCSRAELEAGTAVAAVADLAPSQSPSAPWLELPVAPATRRNKP